MTDIIARIDRLVAEPEAHCWQCHRHLDGGTEDGFCSERCQAAWHAKRVTSSRDTQPRRSAWGSPIPAPSTAQSCGPQFQRIGWDRYLEPEPLNPFGLETPRRNGKSTALLRRSWSCEERGHLWQSGTRVTRCATCDQPVLPWHERARTRLLTRWNWWRGNARRIARTIRRRQP